MIYILLPRYVAVAPTCSFALTFSGSLLSISRHQKRAAILTILDSHVTYGRFPADPSISIAMICRRARARRMRSPRTT